MPFTSTDLEPYYRPSDSPKPRVCSFPRYLPWYPISLVPRITVTPIPFNLPGIPMGLYNMGDGNSWDVVN